MYAGQDEPVPLQTGAQHEPTFQWDRCWAQPHEVREQGIACWKRFLQRFRTIFGKQYLPLKNRLSDPIICQYLSEIWWCGPLRLSKTLATCRDRKSNRKNLRQKRTIPHQKRNQTKKVNKQFRVSPTNLFRPFTKRAGTPLPPKI